MYQAILTPLLITAAVLAQQAPRPDTIFQSGVAALKAGSYSDAEASFRRVAELEPENLRGLLALAQVYMAQKRVDDAIEIFTKELARAPERPDLHIAAGDLDAQAARYDAALAEYEKSVSLMDSKAASDVSVRRGNDPVSALTIPEILPKGAAGVYVREGAIHMMRSDFSSAVTVLRKAKEFVPKDAQVLTNLAIAEEASGDKKAAVDDYRAALAENPRNPVALNNIAFLLTETGGDLYEALRFARMARQAAPQVDDISDTIAWVSLKLGWTDDALHTLREVVLKQPGNEAMRSHLLAAIDQKGEHSETSDRLRALLAAKPTPENERAIVELLGGAQQPAR